MVLCYGGVKDFREPVLQEEGNSNGLKTLYALTVLQRLQNMGYTLICQTKPGQAYHPAVPNMLNKLDRLGSHRGDFDHTKSAMNF